MTKVRALKVHTYGVPPQQYEPGDFYMMEDEHVTIMAHVGNVRRVETLTRDIKPTYPKKYQRRDMKAE